ncbi:CHAT domain-containing protein [Streptomyces sp. SPB162]|uniref:CHAT domain-containing protein n=1 Tax=Streptomyces sp. SPB162 TaxID=2940560 RepID=UPI002404D64C|nr:CHAT domain-containing protein [Streptomyces sp. SPB162]MDF9811473.1 hypothetical protein [Streptomyces sp. SPB162]
MAVGPDITIGLNWQDDKRVVAAVVDGDGLVVAPHRGALVGRSLLSFPFPGDQHAVLLGKVLLPPDVRRRILAELQALNDGDRLRIRVRLPRPSAERGFSLGALPWERVRVPEADVHQRPPAWRAWAAGEDDPQPYRELRFDPRFSVVREVAGSTTAHAPADGGGGAVIADATAVHGDIITPRGVESVPEPAAGSTSDRDGRQVAAALRGSPFESRSVAAPATAKAIRSALPDAALFYFGGHHLDDGLVVASAPGESRGELLDAATLSGWLTGYGVRIAVLMACDAASASVAAPASGSASKRSNLSLAERLAIDGVPYVVAVHGTVSDGASVRFAGRFFHALLQWRDIDVAVAEAATGMNEPTALPVLYTGRRSTTLRLRELRPPRRAVLPSVAHRMALPPAGSRDLGTADERFRVHLETRWCLQAGPLVDVLADPSGDDLVTLLERAEFDLKGGDKERPDRRRWYEVEAERLHEPGARRELLSALSSDDAASDDEASEAHLPGRGSGLVVRRRVHAYSPLLDWPSCLAGLRRLVPDLRAVVFQVHGEDAENVHHAAVEIAGDLRCDEYLIRLPPLRARLGAAPRAGSHALTAAAHVLEEVRKEPAPFSGGPTLPIDAVAVVDDLNVGDGWGDWRAELDVLRSVAARWPAVFPALMEAHAARRTGVGRYASLLLAASRDDELGRWLRAAARRLPCPSDFPRVRVPESVADAVVLGLLRERDPAEARFGGADLPIELEEWQAKGVSAAVDAAVRVAERSTPLTLLDLGTPEDAVALDRAGLLASTDLWALDPKGRSRGRWTLLTRRPLTKDVVAWLVDLSEARRRMVGLAPDAVVPDARLEGDMAEYRDALRPPLPFR